MSAGLQPGNGDRLLCSPDGESHGEGIRERGERQKSSFPSKVNCLWGQRLCPLRVAEVARSRNHTTSGYPASLRMAKLILTMKVASDPLKFTLCRLNHPPFCVN